MILTGGCLCGSVRYRAEPPYTPKFHACHCTDCQKLTGSAFALNMLLPERFLGVDGELETLERTGPSGRLYRSHHCPRCKVRIYGINTERPGFVTLRVGTLEQTPSLTPAIHIWTRSKQDWVVIPEAAASFETEPAGRCAMARIANAG